MDRQCGNVFRVNLISFSFSYTFSNILIVQRKAMVQSQEDAQVLLAVPRCLVKITKDALQRHQRLDKSAKIRPFGAAEAVVVYLSLDNKDTQSSGENYLIPTTVRARSDDDEETKLMLKAALLDIIDLDQQSHCISICLWNGSPPSPSCPPYEHSQPTSALGQIVQTWLLALPSCLLPCPIPDLVSASTWSYVIYHPLLLLPQNTFSTPPWPDLFSTTLRSHLPALYALLSTHLKITHIALNAPIPTLIPGSPNMLRKPENLIPLNGAFGPSLTPTHIPSSSDFDAAFWCTVRQNGIFQTWAPRHTMFSRGNISEKTRLLGLNTLTTKDLGGTPPSATSAVDLYAGIGYFAFCYAKLGVGKILCWELSGWSVEGQRRGSKENGWGVEVFNFNSNAESTTTTPKNDDDEHIIANLSQDPDPASLKNQSQIIIFQENNHHAPLRISALRPHIPPIRHVNCGFLPTSRASWATAVRALDPSLGGWIHAHENIERGGIERRREEVVREFEELVRRWGGGCHARERERERKRERERGDELELELDDDGDYEEANSNSKENENELAIPERRRRWRVDCTHLYVVKSYAPGIMHCVLDIAILPG